jgi:hypothetical protein
MIFGISYAKRNRLLALIPLRFILVYSAASFVMVFAYVPGERTPQKPHHPSGPGTFYPHTGKFTGSINRIQRLVMC